MAMWKKMAAAFGRAVEDPAATKGGRDMVFNSKTIQNTKDRAGDFTTRIEEPDTPAQKAFKAGRYQGQEASELTRDTEDWENAKRVWDNYDADEARDIGPNRAYQNAVVRSGVSKYSVPGSYGDFEERFGFTIDDQFEMPEEHAPGRQANWEREAEGYTDRNLEKDFDEGLNSAIARRKQDVKDWYGKDFPKAMVDEGADTFEEDLWRVIGELRDKGMSGADILNVLKGTSR